MLTSTILLSALAGAAAYNVGPASLPRPALRARIAPTMVAEVTDSVSTLIAEEALDPLGPVLYAQLGAAGAMIATGFGLEFGPIEVPEPEEFEPKEGEVDIYRQSALRYLGYANEVGEAFRPLVPVELVYFSYFAAISYILADTVDKGKQGSENGAVNGVIAAVDTFSWQMLASVLFPSFIINRIVCLLTGLQEAGTLPDGGLLDFIPTAAGLISIPLIILPLDILAHFSMNKTFRKAAIALK